MKYVDMSLELTFAPQTLRIKFEPSEGSMMIDLSTMASLELIQNLQNAKSRDCLFGLMNETLTPMGARFLRSNVLQPSTDAEKIGMRQEAVAEVASKEEMFFAIRSGNLLLHSKNLLTQTSSEVFRGRRSCTGGGMLVYTTRFPSIADIHSASS